MYVVLSLFFVKKFQCLSQITALCIETYEHTITKQIKYSKADEFGYMSRLLCPTWHGDIRWRTSEDECKWFFTPYDLFSWNKYDIKLNIIDNPITFKYIDKGPKWMFILCMLSPLRHAWLFFPFSSCSMLPPSLLGFDCLSRSLSRGPGPPWPPSPELTPFSSGPRQSLTLPLHREQL